MASLSLPRVLQQRKTSLELERENFEKFQVTIISTPFFFFFSNFLYFFLPNRQITRFEMLQPLNIYSFRFSLNKEPLTPLITHNVAFVFFFISFYFYKIMRNDSIDIRHFFFIRL